MIPRPRLARIRPRPGTLYVSRGRTVLATAIDGFVHGAPDEGLFHAETRIVSRWELRIDGCEPIPNVLSNLEQHSFLGYWIVAAPGVDAGPRDRGSGRVPPESRNTLEVAVRREIDDGLSEEIELTNYTRETLAFPLELSIDADFADQADPEAVPGSIRRAWRGGRLRFDWSAEHQTSGQRIERAVEITFRDPRAVPRHRDGKVAFDVRIRPRARWRLAIRVTPLGFPERAERPPRLARTTFTVPLANTLASDVDATLAHAERDLEALLLLDRGDGARPSIPAAGLPLYVAVFGRDALTAGWQAALAGSGIAIMGDSLSALAATQGTRRDDRRDEAPGRMLHEAHTGPLSVLGLDARDRNYGSVTTSGLYAFIAAELWHWTGDAARVRPFIAPALDALAWLDREGDIDGDGLYEYRTRSPEGVRHQAWKDSPDAIVDARGRDVAPPLATCEEQGFVYIAKLHLAETLFWLGERKEARRLFREARSLRTRFHQAFWMEHEGFYALALDAKKRQVRAITSNPGHCVATAIAKTSAVRRVVDRLFEPDLFSGWGIRTLSDRNPAYNPYSYHLGSVWPVEQGTFALGFMRYGLHDRVQQLARAQFEAAALFEFHRLPELFSGHARDARHPFPALYPRANSPQAWSASSVFCLVQAMLGLYPYAPLSMLLVDPHLPEWLPEVTIGDLRVGDARVAIRFERKRDGSTRYRVLEKEGTLRILRQPMPWSLTTSWPQRTRDFLESLLPRR